MKIAFFGTGLMGTGFVARMVANGHQVSVWNRTASRAEQAVAAGATLAPTPQAAIDRADTIHLSLSDDASVDAVLEPIAGHIAETAWIIDHTTTAPTPTAERAARWQARGKRFVHAPVFMTPANCHAGTGIMLISGPQETYDALLTLLASMTSHVVYLGAAPDHAAAYKLFGNLTLLAMTATLGDVNRLAHACGIPTAAAFGLFEKFNPGMLLPQRAARIASGDFTPSFEMTMARKDIRLMIEEAARHGTELALMPAVAALFDASIAAGKGAMDASAAAAVG